MSKRTGLILYLFSVIVLILKLIKTIPLAIAHNLNTSYPVYTTSVERIATFANGCYKQRIIEPDLWNSKRFFETEQLVCPPAVNVTTFTILTQQLQLNSSATNHTTHFPPANNTSIASLPTADFVPASNFMNVPANVTHVPHVAPAKPSPVHLMSSPAVSQASYPTNPTVNHQQSYIPAMFASNVTSHTAVLSKKTGFFGHGKKTNSAKTINSFNWFFVFMVITIFLKP